MTNLSIPEEKIKYPYFDMPFEGRELRKDIWMYTNRPTFYRNPDELWYMPKNYVSDGYSVPWFTKPILKRSGANKNVAGFHDYFCEYGKDGRLEIHYKLAHRLFYEMCTAWIWFEEDQEFRKIIPRFHKSMSWGVKVGGPRWKEKKHDS